MAPKARPPPSLPKFAAGALVAAAVALGASHALLTAELNQGAARREHRLGTLSLNALSSLVLRTGDDGEKLRAATSAWQTGSPGIEWFKVVRFQGLSLEASSLSTDVGELVAPRRLQKEEKPLYDTGQRLRAAFETNRDEGNSRKDEIELSRAETGGSWILTGPLTAAKEVVGLVQISRVRGALAEHAGALAPVGLGLSCVLLVVALFFALGRRRTGIPWAASIACSVVVFAGVAAHGAYARGKLSEQHAEIEGIVSAHAKAQGALVQQLAAAQGLTTEALEPGLWDTDSFRHPYGELTPEGDVAQKAAVVAPMLGRSVVLLGLLSVLVFLVIALGGASWLWTTLVTNRTAYAYITPAMVGMAALVFFPFAYGITLSFTDSNLYNANKSITDMWVGLKNYGDILFDFSVLTRNSEGGLQINYGNFYWTLIFTIIWTVCNVTIGVTVGLALALALNIKNLALRPIYRVMLILPWAVPNYITALIWKGMFHRQFGVVNHALELFGVAPRSWFDQPFSSFITALATNGWLSFPFMMVVSMGALQSIPDELYEAAEVDGASRYQQFRAITLPALRPALVPAIILSVVWTFNMFNIIYLVTGGAPGGATEILVTQAYKHAFERYQYGYAAAYSTVIFLILLAYGVFQNRISKATEA